MYCRQTPTKMPANLVTCRALTEAVHSSFVKGCFVLNTCRSVFGDACSKTTLQRLMRHLHPSNSAKVPSKVLRDWWGI